MTSEPHFDHVTSEPLYDHVTSACTDLRGGVGQGGQYIVKLLQIYLGPPPSPWQTQLSPWKNVLDPGM